MEKLKEILEVGGQFMPHGYCIEWVPWIFWSYLIADAITFFSYTSDFFALMRLYRRRPDLNQGWIIPAFGLFIASCGVVHGLLAVSLFWGIYPVIAGAKILMAFISFPVALVIWPVVNKIIKLPEVEAYYSLVEDVNRLELENAKLKKENGKLKRSRNKGEKGGGV